MKIKEVRLALGLSQSQFAKYFDLNKRTLENWESERYSTPQGIIPLIQRVAYLEKELDVQKEDYESKLGGVMMDERNYHLSSRQNESIIRNGSVGKTENRSDADS